jgi:hypothetical protein
MAEILKSQESPEISAFELELLDKLTDKHASLLDLLVEDLEAYNTDYYANNLDQIPDYLANDALEIIEEITAKLEQKRTEQDEDEKELFDNLLISYLKVIKSKSLVCYKLVTNKLYKAIPSIDPSNKVVHKKAKYPIKIENIMLSIAECERFIIHCGLIIDYSTGSSHSKITDPLNQMDGNLSFVTVGRKTQYLENILKQFIDRNLPLERILAALDKLGYNYVLKQN